MIKFYRKIRYELMEKNKTGKYLKYAIGEIILVMIGILLALQVNNWNQQRIAAEKEELLLKELHDEFVNNKKQLEDVVSVHQMSIDACNKIIRTFPIDLKLVNLDSLQGHMLKSSTHYTFNPSQGVINSLVNTSSFELISNDSLRRTIIAWSDVLSDYQEEEIKSLRFYKEDFLRYWKDNFDWDANLKDERNNLEALSTLQFEFQIKERRANLMAILNDGELEVIRSMIDHIINLTETDR